MKDFEQSARSDCATYRLILEAVALYHSKEQTELLRFERHALRSNQFEIILKGDCSEPLKVLCRREESDFGGFELFEEFDPTKRHHSTLYPAIGFGGTPPEVLDLASAARWSRRWLSQCNSEHKCLQYDASLRRTCLEAEDENHGIICKRIGYIHRDEHVYNSEGQRASVWSIASWPGSVEREITLI